MSVATPPAKRPPAPAPVTQPLAPAERRKRRWPLLPALIFTIIVTQVPMAVTVVISFFSWNVLRPGQERFVGFDNYVTVFTDERLRAAVINTVVLVVAVVAISLILGTVLALLLDRRFIGRSLVRTLLIAPFLVMPMAAALLWKHALYNPTYGLLNGFLGIIGRLFGADSPPQTDWVSSYPMSAVVIALVWQWTPFMMLIVLAGLQGQPGDVIEAARVDGASTWQTFWHITLPHLRQYLELSILLGAIYLLQTFDAIFTITQGGPGHATTNLPYEIYLTMFRKFEYGEAAAAGVVAVIGSIIVATFALRVVSSLFRAEEGTR